ncbi:MULTISPECIES: hypothetical protein [unclassified Microbacterium]|uniref:hypothetical protein n=1 Tax=unclassified Microbacterium TaxID=2609290 RepID=UPI000CFDA5C8|nr:MULTISPECIES: hypothetical protein [unclassified Microbacterium]PQZ53146.1 hypothetical protein CQ032_15685 [Microbacterium sp. MYb43]PQZ74688.1 hypothetical protein CQ031_15030 [Microbacterium sp. MYb40]PRB18776.1 hypothetical protein CQ040_16335 [Microbacterium sp. MYb54]PRB23636.1 hypothetical protein CQ037_17135 [Microbacterium sp. MYb50]PRB63355.1 hypothetical protein CQ021_16770 [Microbacterium sp. MYb24]
MADELTLTRRIERYENFHQSKRAKAVEHEELYYLIDHQIGRVEAQFFDTEHMLPYAVAGLPWPMRRHDARSFVLVRLLLTVLVGWCVGVLCYPGGVMLALVVGGVSAGAFYLLATHGPKLLPPEDLEKRIQLVNKFTDMQLAVAAEDERVAEARRAKRLHEADAAKLPAVEVRRGTETDRSTR